jgi:hypothetical protein
MDETWFEHLLNNRQHQLEVIFTDTHVRVHCQSCLFEDRRLLPAEHQIVTLLCPHAGCPEVWIGEEFRTEWRDHQRVCEYREVKCTAGHVFRASQTEDHRAICHFLP